MIQGINIWAVFAAAASAFVLGGIWYSPLMFVNIWIREAGINKQNKKGHGPVVFGISILLSLIAAGAFAIFLGPKPTFIFAVGTGLVVGLCWVTTSFAINYMFAGRSLKLLLIDGGYHTLQFVLYGIILGLWH